MNNLAVVETGGGDETPELFAVNVTKEEAELLLETLSSDMADFPEFFDGVDMSPLMKRLNAICNGPFLRLVE